MSELSPMTATIKHTLADYRNSICLLLLQLPAWALAGADGLTAQQLVQSMSRAMHELNYDGVFVYRHGQRLSAMRLIHKYGDDGETERLVSLNGTPREIIRNNESVTCIFQDEKSVMLEKSHPYTLPLAQLNDTLDKLSQYYRFSISGQDRVAGYASAVVSVQPRDNYRYGYQLWIDNENYLLLKSELKNESGYPVEQIEFTRLEVLDTIPDEWLVPAIASDGYARIDNMSAPVLQATPGGKWKVGWLPEGFAMGVQVMRRPAPASNNLDHMTYTDGMALVSVFIEPETIQYRLVPGASRVGAVNTFVRHAYGFQVTVIGEVPPATVEKMAVSVSNDN
jgi:sigma-E factor negative regulatory protein RseB